MANWQEPVNTTPYATVLDMIKALATDAATLFVAVPTNQPLSSIRWNRTTKIFEEWNGTAWIAQVIGIPGGGTGAALPGDIAASLGLGTMSVQNANAVAIVGGTIANIYSSVFFTHSGGNFSIAGKAGATALHVNNGFEWGIIVDSGVIRTDLAFMVRNRAASLSGFQVTGDQVVLCQNRLVIPVGADKWATA